MGKLIHLPKRICTKRIVILSIGRQPRLRLVGESMFIYEFAAGEAKRLGATSVTLV